MYAQTQKDTLSINTVEVVANRIPEAYKKTAFDSLTINEAVNLSELLQEHSPVFVKNYGSGGLSTVSFRGTGASHTKVLWNDINLNSPMNGQIDFSLYPTIFFNNAELHHGASGLIDGSGSLGGSVHLSNSTSYNRGLKIGLQQAIGSFNTYTTALKVGSSNKKWFTETQLYFNTSKNNFKYLNNALQEETISTQNNANIKQYGFQQAIYKKNKSGEVGVRLWYFNSDRMLPPTMQVNVNDENQKDESLRALFEWKGLSGNLKYKWVNALIKDQLIYTNTLAQINSKSNSHLISSKLLTRYYLKNNFILTNNISITHESAKADGYNNQHNRQNYTWLLGITKNLNRLNIDVFNRFNRTGENTRLFSPSISVNYGLLKHKQLKIKANTGINYNFPTFNDLYWNPGGNTSLKPEEAQMVEFGVSYDHLKSTHTTIQFEATSFYSYVYNWIIWQPTLEGYWSPSNIKEVENKGIELSVKMKTKINKLTLIANANYSYTASTNLKAKNEFDNALDKQLLYVPYHKINYTIRASIKSFSVNYNYNYTGLRYTSSDNNWYLPANFTSDIGLSKKLKTSKKSSCNISFKVNNLFNQDYQSIAWRPMPGRNYLGTLTFLFN